MKKLLVAGVLAVALAAVSASEAWAWHKFSFNAGISINCESANNCLLWGLIKDGPAPCCPIDPSCQPYCCQPYCYQPYCNSAPLGAPAIDMGVGCSTCAPSYAHASQPRPAANPNGPMQAMYYPNQNYTPTYNYNPQYSNGFRQVPSYWYGY